MPIHKSQTIYNWKRSGLIYDDYDALYETYIKTTECEHCQIEFTENNRRCLDHDHETGLFRKIVCHRCNSMDSYINYPNGYSRQSYYKEYQRANKQKISAQSNQKIECDCGVVVSRRNIARHKHSKKHIEYLNSR